MPVLQSISSAGYGFRIDRRPTALKALLSSQAFSCPPDRITGMRSCTGAMNSLAAVVMMVQVLIFFWSGDSHVS